MARSMDLPGLALSPEELSRAGTALEEAWTTFSAMHGHDRADRTGFEYRRLARLVMKLAQDGALCGEEIAAAAIYRMQFSALS